MSALTVILVVICGLFAATHGQDVAAGVLTIDSGSTSKITPTMCDAAVTGLAFSMVLSEVGGSIDGAVTAINFYYTDNSDYSAAVKKSASANAVSISGTITVTAGATAGTTSAQTVDLLIDDTDCTSYTHLCAVVTTTSDSVTANDFSCIAIKPANIAAGALTVTGPTLADIKYTCAAATTITFSLVITESAGFAGSLTDINLYFTNNAQYETAAIVKSAAMVATVANTPLAIIATNGFTVMGATAALTLDSTNCASYTHLCAVITVVTDSGGTADDDTCVELSATAAGVKDCTGCTTGGGGTTTTPDVCAGPIGITSPTLVTGTSGTCSAAATVVYTLSLQGLTCTATTCTVDFYYTNNVDYGAAGIAKSAAGTQSVLTTANPLTVAACGADVSAAGTATIAAADPNCGSAGYTHLCAVISCTDDAVATNDFSCVSLAGSTTGSDGCSGTAACKAADCPSDGDKNGGTTTTPGSSLLVLPLVISAIYGVITY